MSEFAIKVENVSKAYTIWKDPSARLKHPFLDLAGELFPALRPKIDQKLQGLCTEFYALKDVSFEVKKGESVGIIGRNGSGKSTLLQIIAGTLQPTEGSVTVNGRVAALLELGSGFNPEFTGRENVYLNCSILGLTKAETDDRFDSIAEFADIGDFLEQPVKTYSSGMTMRLAFAVIAHVDADILIVDEALSVGDMAFRNKCIESISKLQVRGTTILLVSHDGGMVQLFCNKAIWIKDGLLKDSGAPNRICQDFSAQCMGIDFSNKADTIFVPQKSDGKAKFSKIELNCADFNGDKIMAIGQTLNINLEINVLENIKKTCLACSIWNTTGDWIVGVMSNWSNIFIDPKNKGDKIYAKLVFPNIRINPGDYLLSFSIYEENLLIAHSETDLGQKFSIRTNRPTYGRIEHEHTWEIIKP